MSAERSFEAWEEVQRHGQDLADRLAQGFTGLIQSHMPPPPFPWPPSPPIPQLFDLDLLPPSSTFVKPDFKLDPYALNSSLIDFGSRIGRAGADFGNCLDGFLQHFFRGLPLSPVSSLSFKLDEHPQDEVGVLTRDLRNDSGRSGGLGLTLAGGDESGCLGERLRDFAFVNGCDDGQSDRNGEVEGDDAAGFSVRGLGHNGKPQVLFVSELDWMDVVLPCIF